MKKFLSISLALLMLAACSAQENSEEEKKVEELPVEEKVEIDAEQTESKEGNESGQQQVDQQAVTSTSEKQDKGEVEVEIKKDTVYVEELKQDEQIIDVAYSIFEGLNFATLTITVADTVTKEQVKEIAKEQEAKIEEEYPEYVPVVIVNQKGQEVYSSLDEE